MILSAVHLLTYIGLSLYYDLFNNVGIRDHCKVLPLVTVNLCINITVIQVAEKTLKFREQTLLMNVLCLCVNIIIADIWFFVLHYLFHNVSILYKIHKTHHKYTNPFTLSALYANPIEYIVVYH